MQILTRARELILKPYIKMVPVGHGGEMTEETIEDFEKVSQKLIIYSSLFTAWMGS